MKLSAVLFLTVTMWATSCTPPEKVAYETAVGAKAYTHKMKDQHPECNPGTSALCVNLAKAVSAKDTLIDAAEIYCAGPDFDTGGACNPPKKGTPAGDQALAKLNAAISGYKQAENDFKSTLGAKP